MRQGRRRWKNALLLLCAIYAGGELLSFAFYWIAFGECHSYARVRELRAGVLARAPSTESGSYQDWWALHPFLGYVRNPESGGELNAHGFQGESLFSSGGSDGFHVIVTGGSVAERIFMSQRGALERILSSAELRLGEPVRIFCLCHQGYKQPQQFHAISYALSLGARIDAVVNLDGVNEVTLGGGAGQPHRFPAYPDLWTDLAQLGHTTSSVRAAGDMQLVMRSRVTLASLAGGLSFSVTANTIWRLMDRYLDGKERNSRERLGAEEGGRPRFDSSGPVNQVDRDSYYTFLARVWENSSRLLHDLGRTRGFAYVHVLQPTLYVNDPEPVPLETRREHVFAEDVRSGYPRLRSRGQRMVRDGLRFVDLTELFSNSGEPVFLDRQCHLTARGEELVAQRIGEALVEAIRARRR